VERRITKKVPEFRAAQKNNELSFGAPDIKDAHSTTSCFSWRQRFE
jgi:hypothetical protein